MGRSSDAGLEAELKKCPAAGTFWRHCHGVMYFVEGCALLESTLEPLVIYRRMGGGPVFARPLSKWADRVMWPDGKPGPRFRQEV